ncbi:unnamed protein product [Closterium sp. NIES-54]
MGHRGLAPTLLLLPLATAKTSPLNSSTPSATIAVTTTPTAATSATPTPTAATTAATEAPTPATTPTVATTSTASIASTTTSPAATATTFATLALAAVALPTKSRSSPDILSTKDVNISSRSVRGGKGGGGTPLKEGCARSATSSNYSDYASLCCKEVLLGQVDSEVFRVKCQKSVPGSAKRVWEAGDYEVGQYKAAESSNGRGRVTSDYNDVQGFSSLVLAKVSVRLMAGGCERLSEQQRHG